MHLQGEETNTKQNKDSWLNLASYKGPIILSYGQLRYWQLRNCDLSSNPNLTTSYRTLGKTFVFPDSILSSKEMKESYVCFYLLYFL